MYSVDASLVVALGRCRNADSTIYILNGVEKVDVDQSGVCQGMRGREGYELNPQVEYLEWRAPEVQAEYNIVHCLLLPGK